MKFSIKSIAVILSLTFAILSTLSSCRTNNTESNNSFSSEPIISSEIPVSSEEPVDNGIRLVISSPAKNAMTVTEPTFSFTGTSDPAESLTVNGIALERDGNGIFTYATTLNVGKNTYTFIHKGETKVYTINYRYVIITAFSPTAAQSYRSGSTIVVNATARIGSDVKASFNGKTISLTRDNTEETASEFVEYNGAFTLPNNNARDLNLGKITFKGTHNGKSESFSTGNITCRKNEIVVDYDPNATPTGGKYMNVGSGYIAEIVADSAETFDGNVTNVSLSNGSVDWSRPTNNYLPKGTLDYCSTSYVNYKEFSYVTLRAGYRVYLKKQDKPSKTINPIVRQYIGTLPDHNEIKPIGFSTVDNQTVLIFDTLWKAPFYFDIKPQNYYNPATKDYRIDAVTYNYIDITFCYATLFDGEIIIPEDNPLFKSATIIENKTADGTKTRDYTLRLFLKKQGGFYGWDAYYNENNQLCFEFLNPKIVTSAENDYKTDLSGTKILIDVGHGGIDSGAIGFSNNHPEAARNLNLANKLKAELIKTGATVYLTRTGNTTSTVNDKTSLLKRIKPDLCLAIHHDSSTKSSPNGFGAYYYNAFTKKASEAVFYATKNTGNAIYKNFTFKWHAYFMSRVTNCPVVLTENGFISNSYDYNNIINEAKNTEKAKALARGIVDYFNSIQ